MAIDYLVKGPTASLSSGMCVPRATTDGWTQAVRVKVDAGAVRFEEGPVGGRAPAEVREAIDTRGKSVIESLTQTGRYYVHTNQEGLCVVCIVNCFA